jgi:Adenylosuccinate synthetase
VFAKPGEGPVCRVLTVVSSDDEFVHDVVPEAAGVVVVSQASVVARRARHSLLHSPHFPRTTSRDTTAAGALAETGLSPFDVENIVLVLRSFQIRVAGDSGPFGGTEIDCKTLTRESGSPTPVLERTSVTDKVRRVARFDPVIVREAIAATELVMPLRRQQNGRILRSIRVLWFPEPFSRLRDMDHLQSFLWLLPWRILPRHT